MQTGNMNINLFSKLIPRNASTLPAEVSGKVGGPFAAVKSGQFERMAIPAAVSSKLAKFFEPVKKMLNGPVGSFVRKNKKLLLITGGIATVGGILAAIFSGKKKATDVLVDQNSPDVDAVTNAVSVGNILSEYSGEVNEIPVIFRTLVSAMSSETNVNEELVCRLADAAAAICVTLDSVEPGSLEYFIAQTVAFKNGSKMDKNYRLANLKVLKKVSGLGMARFSGSTADMIRSVDTLVFED